LKRLTRDALQLTAALPTNSYFNLDEKEKKKVELNLRNRIEQGDQNGVVVSSTSTTSSVPKTLPQSSTASTIRIEVAKNDGQKSMLKPIIVKNSDFEQLKKQVKRIYCQIIEQLLTIVYIRHAMR